MEAETFAAACHRSSPELFLVVARESRTLRDYWWWAGLAIACAGVGLALLFSGHPTLGAALVTTGAGIHAVGQFRRQRRGRV